MTRKPQGPMAEKARALLKKQEQGINMGEARIHLGRFAKSFAQVNQKSRSAEQAASVPPPRKQKTYDDIEKEIEEVVLFKVSRHAHQGMKLFLTVLKNGEYSLRRRRFLVAGLVLRPLWGSGQLLRW